ncbi:MAG: hypothetical protein E7399_00545 [Ruminococcaceae bacterium]|nr:hypothetical protein [Oscillospiraceae bacterium]
MAMISGLFHQEQDLERAVDLLEQSGFSHLFISENNPQALPVPGSFLVTNLQREPNTESNFGVNPGLPLPFFRPVPENAKRLTVQVKQEEKTHALTLLKRTKAKEIRTH